MEQENPKDSQPAPIPADSRPAEEAARAAEYDVPPPAVPVKEVRRVYANRSSPAAGRRDEISADDRREFFSEAMREALAPLAGLLERKINPFLAALEAIPAEVERLTEVSLPAMERVLDQPLLGMGGSGGGDVMSARTFPLPQNGGAAPEYLRPPGAMAPGEFETVCSRCAQCVAACPAQAIQLDAKHLVADGLPYIVAAHQPCVVCDELACMKSCPTGALMLVDRLKIKMGTARVDAKQCLRDRGEDCRLCVEVCPITEGGGGASPLGDAIFIHEQSGKVRVRKNACIGCGLCESRCPTSPPAIRVDPFRAAVDPIIA
jgi:ferredoxin-type protein NapG